ncbi:MAG: DUF4139 domain-containing protein [Sedimentisphaerales bacterium]|nr:DUF4139 domain-containing protein [Sedimentisphaerales bacterium]HNY79743.1 DUF4139 domain-containing protein [Sedimentisphaerales bacterium]HOC64750.1 DUF4139 domain-containing protein [Sedimentisphaerales bacterium]HOH65732.1 DUF4139 domain-containing protein [Sedimentisphaerales bacterium]HQA88551.1 DUF4139 domain-containing protein [Sedimentisphaerales bacterium]
MTRHRYTLVAALLMTAVAWAKVDLVTLPPRDAVQLTIYNSADLTLARESRALTLKEGANALQFSWADTLIDPTSLEMLPKANADAIDIAELVYPPRVTGLGLWNVASEVSGKVPVEISYLTSGLSWRAFYMGTLSADEKTMRLQGYVRVTNNSGEDYESAQVRVIVGKVHLLDEIAELARRQYPYGRPVGPVVEERLEMDLGLKQEMEKSVVRYLGAVMADSAPTSAKEVVKEGLSEYFLYTIEGTETIPNGWSKRLLSFDVDAVPVVSLYKYEEDRYGPKAVRFLSFANDAEHKLGQTPIPDGTLKVYRGVDDAKHLSYEGQSSFKYIPVGDEVELNLGAVEDVVVEPKMMEYRTDNYRFDRNGNVAGWDEIRTFAVTVKNTRSIPVKVEIRRNFDTPHWTLERTGDVDEFEKVDVDTVEFTLLLPAGSQRRFEYTLTTCQGTRREDWQRIAR